MKDTDEISYVLETSTDEKVYTLTISAPSRMKLDECLCAIEAFLDDISVKLDEDHSEKVEH